MTLTKLSLIDDFKFVFFQDERYSKIVEGFFNTLKITGGALLVGIIIGILIAAVRTSYDKNKEAMKLKGGIGYAVMSALNFICKIYLTVIRGTPVVVQLMIA